MGHENAIMLTGKSIQMNFRRSVLAAAAALVVSGSFVPGAALGASVDGAFRSAVARILSSVRDQQDFLRNLSNAEFNDFVACAQRVMSDAPAKRKEYVLAAKDQSEMRQRFDQVALDNRAALKQRITQECA